MKPKNNYCIVPMCTNTSRNNPNKEFIIVPRDVERRKLWLQAIRRKPGDISEKTTAYVCEDHFQLEEDLENYMEFKMMGTKKRLKPHVIPHKFQCQMFKAPRPAKRKRLEFIRSLKRPKDLHYYVYIQPKPMNTTDQSCSVNESRTIKISINEKPQLDVNNIQNEIEEIVIKSEPPDDEPHFETIKVEPYFNETSTV